MMLRKSTPSLILREGVFFVYFYLTSFILSDTFYAKQILQLKNRVPEMQKLPNPDKAFINIDKLSGETGGKMKLPDVVTLTEDMPELKLYRGQVGTIVEEYEPQVFG